MENLNLERIAPKIGRERSRIPAQGTDLLHLVEGRKEMGDERRTLKKKIAAGGGDVDVAAHESPSREKKVAEQICVLVRERTRLWFHPVAVYIRVLRKMGYSQSTPIKMFLPPFNNLGFDKFNLLFWIILMNKSNYKVHVHIYNSCLHNYRKTSRKLRNTSKPLSKTFFIWICHCFIEGENKD